jgi:hypothetical protein
MNNSIAHLVARALRARRTVIWGYRSGGTSTPYRVLSRSLILADVRSSDTDVFWYGLALDCTIDRSKLPNPKSYGLNVYAYPEPTAPKPPAVPYTEQIRNLVALRLQNEAELLRSLGNIFDTAQADKLLEISEFLRRETK